MVDYTTVRIKKSSLEKINKIKGETGTVADVIEKLLSTMDGCTIDDIEEIERDSVAINLEYHTYDETGTFHYSGFENFASMDKATGKEFLVDGKPVIAEAEFTAKKENGEVEVTFTFNGEGMEGKDVVVFERLFLVEVELEMQIAEHEDINDEGQTVKLVKEPPVNTPKTGDDSDGYIWVVLAILAGTSFIVQLIRYYKKHEETEE